MRRTAFLFVLLVAAIGVAASQVAARRRSRPRLPRPSIGETTTETTETETTETDETETETTETDETETETTVTTPAVEGDPAAGKQVFLGASACGGCHTLADAGSSGAVGPNLDDAQPSEELVLDRVTNGQGGMPSFSSTLNEQQIADVAAYVSSVAGS